MSRACGASTPAPRLSSTWVAAEILKKLLVEVLRTLTWSNNSNLTERCKDKCTTLENNQWNFSGDKRMSDRKRARPEVTPLMRNRKKTPDTHKEKKTYSCNPWERRAPSANFRAWHGYVIHFVYKWQYPEPILETWTVLFPPLYELFNFRFWKFEATTMYNANESI